MIKKILFCLILFWNGAVMAQLSDLSFQHFNVEQGLSQSWVMSLEQDDLGFIWIGTSNGLNKFDGYNFTIYSSNNQVENSLPSNFIQSLELDDTGNLWVGTNAGLCMYDYKSDYFIRQDSFTQQSVNCLLVNNNILYAGTSDGIFILDIATNKILAELSTTLNNQFAIPRINAIAANAEDNIFIGTSEGLFTFSLDKNNPAHEAKLISIEYLSEKNISALEVDSDNRVWIGTSEFGLYLLDDASKKEEIVNFHHQIFNESSIGSGKILALTVDNDGKLWIGIENYGLDILDLKNFKTENASFHHNLNDPSRHNSLSNNSVYSIFNDNRGDIWFGIYGGGLNFYNNDGDNFKVLNHIHNEENSLINNNVNVIEKRNGHLWVGTEGGISVLNLATHSYRHYTHKDGDFSTLSTNAIWSIYFDALDNVWVGTWAGGLNKLDKSRNKFSHFNFEEDNEHSLASDNIFAIAEDSNKHLWMATMGGGLNKLSLESGLIDRISLGSSTNFSTLINELRHLYFNSRGELWFSTSISVGFLNSITLLPTHFYPNFKDTLSFSGNGAYIIFEDSKKNMWFGTDAGLNYFSREESTFKNYSIEDGLPDNSIKSIEEDCHGNFWMGTNKGLVKFSNAITIPESPVFKTYDASDGLPGNEFNRRSSYKDEAGVFYFGGTNGITIFHPDSIKENTLIPKVVFTDFLIFNKPVSIGSDDSPLNKHISLTKELTLKPYQTVFTINFAALNFIASEKNTYAYILEGFDPDWNLVGSKKTATYTNLNPGAYIFKVKAANNDGFWCEKPSELVITVLPPWYKTIWAFIGYIVLLLISIFTFILLSQRRFKEKQALQFEKKQREQDKELTQQRLQFFTNISHEFRTPLTLIYGPIEDILKNCLHKIPDEVRVRLATIYKNALRLNRLANELMDFRKLQFNKLKMNLSQQDICAFTRNVTNLFTEEAKLQKINLVLDIADKPVFLWFDPSMIEKVLFNLLSNAFKVTPEKGEIKVHLQLDSQPKNSEEEAQTSWVSIGVSDTGAGLEQHQIEKIFERFYQTDNQSKTYYSSTGIGLSLSKSLIEKHEGDISVESTVGKGSNFVFWLRTGNEHFADQDLKKASREVVGEHPYPLPKIELKDVERTDIKNTSILIVEDNKELRKYLVGELEHYYKVYEAANGEIGIELTEKHLPDIIVSDVLMPEKDGYELCRAIKSNQKISHIPIILLTARAAIEDQIEGTEAGADAYIIKPFNPSLLKSKINQLLNSRRVLFAKFSSELNVVPGMDVFTNYDKDFLKKVSNFVLDNIIDSELSVEVLGDKMNLSRSQLYRKIKSLTGHTATEFIRIIRLEQAKKLITISKLPINEVCYKVGFATPSYFSKCYKEHFGKLPSEEL